MPPSPTAASCTRPYAILELFNSKGELVYSRERDEPEAPQVVSLRVAEQMNQMMQAVVNEGTGRRAILDFTHAVGKTGTSSSWRDAWFIGFTGALVTGVWVGHDDFRPMWLNGSGVTGGSLPTTAWHAFMSVAHTNRNIPTIPGLPPHPAQVAEQQRLAELKRTDPGLAQAQIGTGSAEEVDHHVGPDARCPAAAGRQHAPGQRPAADANQRPDSGCRAAGHRAQGPRSEGDTAGSQAWRPACGGFQHRHPCAAMRP